MWPQVDGFESRYLPHGGMTRDGMGAVCKTAASARLVRFQHPSRSSSAHSSGDRAAVSGTARAGPSPAGRTGKWCQGPRRASLCAQVKPGEDAPSGGRGTMDNRRPETAQSGSTRACPGDNPGFPANGGMAEWHRRTPAKRAYPGPIPGAASAAGVSWPTAFPISASLSAT